MDMLLSSDPATKLEKGLRGWLDARINDQPGLAAARGRLLSSGMPEDRLKLFPPSRSSCSTNVASTKSVAMTS